MDESIFNHALNRLEKGHSISADEMTGAMSVIMGGHATEEQITFFLTELAQRKPTGEELFGATRVMKQRVDSVRFPEPKQLLDTCGTGGAPKTFNVSTLAGLVCAAAGVRVAKHGNRSRTGRGSAEVLEALGVNIHSTVEEQEACLQEVGICFCFAPNHHKAVKHVMPVRKKLGFPTIFNLLGPLTNPCNAGVQLLGVWDEQYMDVMAEALLLGNATSGAIAHSADGLDEISISAPTRLSLVGDGAMSHIEISPEQCGFDRVPIDVVTAQSLEEAVSFFQRVLGGEDCPLSHFVAMNSGVGLFLSGVSKSIPDGVQRAMETIKSGAVQEKLTEWVGASNNNSSTQHN